MKVTIWDKINKKWIDTDNIKYIVMLSKYEFKLDGIVYDTNRYELNFIHDRSV